MKKTRITKTAKKHDFTRDGENWKLADPATDDWYNALPTKTFVARGNEGQYYSVTASDDRDYLGFVREDGEEITIGYDKASGIIFLDVDKKAFHAGKDNFFRVEQVKE